MIVFGYILLRHLFRWFIVIYCDSLDDLDDLDDVVIATSYSNCLKE